MKAFIVFSTLVCFALGARLPHPGPYAPAPAPYAPPQYPAPYHPPQPYPEEKIAPKPFAYEYGGVDDYGRRFQKAETQDEYGVVQGQYSVELPDGRTQIVTYTADHENGFVADVKYEGEAIPYAPPKAHPKPGPYAPKPYAPAPYAPAPYAPKPYAPAPYAPAPYRQ